MKLSKWFWFLAFGMYTTCTLADNARDNSIFGDSAQEKKQEKAKDNTTSFGGRLMLNTAAGIPQGRNISDTLYNYNGTIYTYIDAQPNDLTRGFIRLRAIHPSPYIIPQNAESSPPRFDLDESWIKLATPHKEVFFTFGRQHVKWGTGRFWNPSDFLAPSALDPLAVYDYRLGTHILKVHYPVEKNGANYYAIIDIDNFGIYKRPGFALRAEFLGKSTEFSFTGYSRENRPLRFAADLSMGLGAVDVYGEFVCSTSNRQTFYGGDGSIADHSNVDTYSRSRDWIPQLVTGVRYEHQYSEQKHVLLEAEYFYNDMGYSYRELELLALAYNDAQALYAGRHYGAFLVGLPNPGSLKDTSFYFSTLANLSDYSGLARISTQIKIYKEVLLEIWASTNYGREGEFRFKLPAGFASTLQSTAGELSPVAFASGIAQGVGLNMSLNF